ncbi:mitochondrial 18 KDa protein-domain-containing protein [Corynascus novoguineensis]|uniref:Mitochondrial fission process protein 1 n=1 Tax=Corynascus novoguineensis TaxID=1126955 RepID=A0AAN7HQ42_9PEZI|nr:mitochondrial 18 KDa protein-domain-containing protein [Corynascus novoguineensis]
MWPWSSSSDKADGAPTARNDRSTSTPSQNATDDLKRAAADLDPKKLPEREKLPPKLQSIIDKQEKEEKFFDELVEGYVPPSTDSNVRYAGYAARFRTILLSAHRYVAYTSDIGESFRPVAHPWLVRGAYGISWAYILGDVSYEGYKAYLHNQRVLNPQLELTTRQQHILGLDDDEAAPKPAAAPAPRVVTPLEDYRTVMLQRAIFQSVASMGLPAFTIHSVVRYSGRAMKDVKNARVRTWGPIGLGLAVVPFLPAIFDKPVENAVEWAFHKGFEKFGGPQAVGNTPLIGRERRLSERPKEKKE